MTARDELLALLTDVRMARIELLRNPAWRAQIRANVNAVEGKGRKVMRKMLAEDLKLMRRMDRQERRT